MNMHKLAGVSAIALFVSGAVNCNVEAGYYQQDQPYGQPFQQFQQFPQFPPVQQGRAVTKQQEQASLQSLHVVFPRLFKKFSGAAIPFIIKVLRHPSDSLKEKILAVVDTRPVSADMARQLGENSWGQILEGIVNGFFPNESIAALQHENSALGNIVTGLTQICAALDGHADKRTAEAGIAWVDQGIARLKIEYLRGPAPLTNASPRTTKLYNKLQQQLQQQQQNQFMYQPFPPNDQNIDAPRDVIVKGLKKALLRGYFVKQDTNEINEGIDMIIDGVLRLNFQRLKESF